jgi:hypothetical protein
VSSKEGIVERPHSCSQRFRRLVVRYECWAVVLLGLGHIAVRPGYAQEGLGMSSRPAHGGRGTGAPLAAMDSWIASSTRTTCSPSDGPHESILPARTQEMK